MNETCSAMIQKWHVRTSTNLHNLSYVECLIVSLSPKADKEKCHTRTNYTWRLFAQLAFDRSEAGITGISTHQCVIVVSFPPEQNTYKKPARVSSNSSITSQDVWALDLLFTNIIFHLLLEQLEMGSVWGKMGGWHEFKWNSEPNCERLWPQ